MPIGSNTVSTYRLGSSAVDAIRLGADLVWPISDVVAPTLSNVVWNSGTGVGSVDTNEGGTLYLCTHLAANTAVADAAGGWSSTTAEEFTDTVPSSGTVVLDFTETSASSSADRMSFYIRDAAGNNSTVETVTYVYPVAAGPTFISGTAQADDLNGSGVTITDFFPDAGTYVLAIGDTPQNTNAITYTISGPNVSSSVLLSDTTAEIASDRTNAYMYLVTVTGSGASDMTITAGGTGNSFERGLLLWEAPDRTATGAITGVAKVSNDVASDISAVASSVPSGYQVFAIYSNRTGSTTGVTWSGSFVDGDEDYDATGAGAANRHAGASLVTGSLGDVTATATGTADDLGNSQSSAVIVALDSV